MVPGGCVGYDPSMSPDVDTLPEDPVLRAMVLGLRAEIAGIAAANRAYEALVQALRITIARLKKQRFGASSEKIEREIEQLELALESLETAPAADPTPKRTLLRAATPRRIPSRRSGVAASRGSPRMHRASASCSIPASAAPTAAARCGWWARTSPRSSTSSRPS